MRDPGIKLNSVLDTAPSIGGHKSTNTLWRPRKGSQELSNKRSDYPLNNCSALLAGYCALSPSRLLKNDQTSWPIFTNFYFKAAISKVLSSAGGYYAAEILESEKDF